MNRKQYFAVSWFFFVLMFFLMWFQATYFYPSLGAQYQLMKSAIVSVIILLCFPLFFLFQILALLEPKNELDDVPKKHREVMKLALLEREVDNLKRRLKKEGKIKN